MNNRGVPPALLDGILARKKEVFFAAVRGRAIRCKSSRLTRCGLSAAIPHALIVKELCLHGREILFRIPQIGGYEAF